MILFNRWDVSVAEKNIYFGADLDRGMLNEIFTIAEWAVVQILRPAL